MIIIDEISIIIIVSFIIKLFHKHVEDANRSLDPRAWAKKYFSMASDSWNLLDILISGINDNILISSAAHVINQLFLDTAINVLIIIVE